METINLDELESKQRTVTLKGTAYEVKDMTVDGFIEFSQKSKELEAKRDGEGKLDVADYMRSMADTAKLALPDVPEDVWKQLSVKQLAKLVEFLEGKLEQGAPQPQAAAPAAGEGEAPKS